MTRNYLNTSIYIYLSASIECFLRARVERYRQKAQGDGEKRSSSCWTIELYVLRAYRLFFLGGSPGKLVPLSDHIFMLVLPLSSISWNMGRPHVDKAWHSGMTMCWMKPG